MLNPFTRQPITLSLLPCFALGTLGWLSAAHGQANVTVTAGTAVANSGVTTSVNGSTTATFNEITPASFYGTNGTSANPTSSYTSPTTLTNASTYGTVTIAGITPATASAVGSFVSGSSSGAYGTPTNDTSTYVAIGGSARPGPLTLTFSNAGTNYFGLDWASPDSYNSVMLTFANGATATYTPGTTNGGVQSGRERERLVRQFLFHHPEQRHHPGPIILFECGLRVGQRCLRRGAGTGHLAGRARAGRGGGG